MIPFSVEHVRSLKVADTFTTDGMMPGLCMAPLTWEVGEVSDQCDVIAEVKYFGVKIGQFALIIRDDKVTVEEF